MSERGWWGAHDQRTDGEARDGSVGAAGVGGAGRQRHHLRSSMNSRSSRRGETTHPLRVFSLVPRELRGAGRFGRMRAVYCRQRGVGKRFVGVVGGAREGEDAG